MSERGYLMASEGDAPETFKASLALLSAFSFKSLLVLSFFGSGSAYLAGFASLALVFAIPVALVLLSVAVRSAMLCIVVLIFFQQNDVILAITGLPVLNKAIAALAILAVGLKVTTAHLNRTLSFGFPVFAFMAGMVLLAWVSLLYSADTDEAFEQAMSLLNMSVLAILFAFGVRGSNQVHLVLVVLILSMLVSASVTLFDSVNGEPLFRLSLEGEFREASWDGALRSASTTLGAIPAAATMLLGGTVLAMVMTLRAPVPRGFYAVATLVGSAAVIATLTRSATVTLGAVTVMMLFSLRKERIFVPLAFLSVGFFAVIIVLAPPQVWSKFGAIGDTSTDWTLERRVSYQVIGTDLFKERPILGVGAGNFRYHYVSDDYKFVPGRSEEPRPLHNVYLQFAAELGIVGLGLLLGLLFSTFRLLLAATRASDKLSRALAQAVLFCFVAMCLQLVFLSNIAIMHLWIGIGLAVALARDAASSALRIDRS